MEIKISITTGTVEKAQQILCMLNDFEALTAGAAPIRPTEPERQAYDPAYDVQRPTQQPVQQPPYGQQPAYMQQQPVQQPVQQPAYMQQQQQPVQQPAYMQQQQQPAYMQQQQQPAYMQQQQQQPAQQPAYMQQPPAGAPTTAPDYTPEQLGRAVAAFADKAQDNRERAMACLKAQGVDSITQLTTPAQRGAFAVALRQIGVQI